METKGEHPGRHVEKGKVHPVLRAYFEFNQLKLLFRQGWLQRGITREQCESVAEHSFGVAMLAMLIVDTHFPELDSLKVMRLALLHDLGETHAGDITPADGISRAEKKSLERSSVREVLAGFPGLDQYLLLWTEYEEGTSPEALLIRRVDRLEMALQARVYECQFGTDLEEFYQSAAHLMDTAVFRELFADILAMRKPDQRH